MNPFPIPVRPAPLAGPGSRPADEAELSVLSLPRGMQTFEMPRVPERVDPRALAAARELLARFLDTPAGLDLAGTAPAVVDIVNQVLGEGEVSIRARDAAADDGEWHIQETAFAGYWRCCRLDADGHIASDALVAAAIPPSVFEAARAGTATALAAIELPEGAMNAPALLIEIGAALPGAAAGGSRQVNLSLLPLAPADRTLLGQALPAGGVSIISRGFGNCRIQSTAVRDVWRVQYFNSMNTLILDTIEVTAVPEVALASDDDLADSCTRLAELVQWMGEA